MKDAADKNIQVGDYAVFASEHIVRGLLFVKIIDIKKRCKVAYTTSCGATFTTWTPRTADILVVPPNIIPPEVYNVLKDL